LQKKRGCISRNTLTARNCLGYRRRGVGASPGILFQPKIDWSTVEGEGVKLHECASGQELPGEQYKGRGRISRSTLPTRNWLEYSRRGKVHLQEYSSI
jgi:hypothetical protein